MPRTVVVEDLLSSEEAALLAGVSHAHLRVLHARKQFPAPIRSKPNLWLRADVLGWKQTRTYPKE